MVQKKRVQAGYYEHDEYGSKSIGVEVKLIDRQPYISSSSQQSEREHNQRQSLKLNGREEKDIESVCIKVGDVEGRDYKEDDDEDTVDTNASSITTTIQEEDRKVEVPAVAREAAVENAGEDGVDRREYENKNINALRIVNSLDVAERKQIYNAEYERSNSASSSNKNRTTTSDVNSIPSLSNSTKKNASFQVAGSGTSLSSEHSSNSKTKQTRKTKQGKKGASPQSKHKSKTNPKATPPSYEEIESQLLQQALASGDSCVIDMCYASPSNTNHPHFDMRSWLASQYLAEECISPPLEADVESNDGSSVQPQPSEAGSYSLIVHEIRRGNWTWCLAWSPDGKRLALASENHHLAIVDTSSSSVWKIIHDKRITSASSSTEELFDRMNKKQVLSSIRAIAWGHTYMAVGGTGDSVSILDPNTYLLLHTIENTGFVGSLDWRPTTNRSNSMSTLAIGARSELCLIVDITFRESGGIYESAVLHSVQRKDWVNAVAFSPGGTMIAIGDRAGKVSAYVYLDSAAAAQRADTPAKEEGRVTSHNSSAVSSNTTLQLVKEFKFSAAVLTVEWSACGGFLYVGGENFKASFIQTNTWTVTHEIKRDQWVQFLSPSHTGLNVAIGGSSNALSIIDCQNEFMPVVKSIDFGAPVLLVSKWHPSDQYLAIGGQDGNVLVVETTNVRYVESGFLRLEVGIQCMQLSPSGTVLVIARQDGVITFMDTTQSTFVILYEMVLGLVAADATTNENANAADIEWSPDGLHVAIGSGDVVVVIARMLGGDERNKGYHNSRFSLVKVIRGMRNVTSISFSPGSNIMVVTGPITKVFDAGAKFACIHDIKTHGLILSSALSHDGTLLAFLGRDTSLTIYSTATSVASNWKKIFEIKTDGVGTSLAWAPFVAAGLKYLAYGGESKNVTIIEVRAVEESWEMVLEIPRKAVIHDLDWSSSGMLAIATSNGTATIVDLSYLLTGTSVIEMNYNWQRQGITCLTEIQRKHNQNKMRSLQWLGPKATDGNVLALAGSDGIFELIDMTDRKRIDEYFESSSTPTFVPPVSASSTTQLSSTIHDAIPQTSRIRSGSIHKRMTHL